MMELLEAIQQSQMLYRLGWALIHTVWLGAGVALAFAIVLVILRRRSANARYLAGCAALVMMAALPLVIFLGVGPPRGASQEAESAESVGHPASVELAALPLDADESQPTPAGADDPMQAAADAPLLARTAQALEPALPWIVLAWAAGVLLLSIWQLGGWVAAERLRRVATQPGETDVIGTVLRLARAMRISGPVKMLVSTLVRVPTVVGWLRPVILMPAGLATGLSPQQLQAVLAHELAHIRRYDYLVNLLQSLVETLLFYHPAVWFISRRIRAERENCCDDMAVAAGAEPLSYAESLVHVARRSAAPARRGQPAIAAGLGATGRPSQLGGRIRRLLGAGSEETGRFSRGWPIALAFLGAILAGTCLSMNVEAETAGKTDKAGSPGATGAGPKGASTKPAGTIPLGQVIERTIGDVDEGERDHLIDFETGKLFALPGGFGGWPAPRRTEWMTQAGRDALVDGARDGWVIGGYDFQAASMGAAKWAAIRLEDVRARLRAGEPGVRTLTRGRRKSYAVGRPWSPDSILAFKTRDGGIGVLQVLDFAAKPKGMKIRYKMLQRPKTKKPPTPPATQPGGKGVHVPDADTKGARPVLDLASGEMLPVGKEDQFGHFGKLGKGDLAYDRVLICLRGATARMQKPGKVMDLKVVEKRGDTTAYELPRPGSRLLVRVAGGKQFEVELVSRGIRIEYDQPLRGPMKGHVRRKVHVHDADTKGLKAVLHLASGEMLPVGKDDQFGHFTKLGKGDLAYDRELICLRGATAKTATGKALKILERRGDMTAYEIRKVPLALVVSTADGRGYRIGVLSRGVLVRYKKLLTRPAPSGASTQPAETIPLGQVIERVVNDDGAAKDFLIDLDTGRLYSPPRHVKGKDKIAAWFREKGIDAGAETNPAGAGLWGLEMVVIPVASKLWDEDPLLGIRDDLERGKPGTPAVMSALGNLPRTYVFKTREGGIGVLQVLEVNNATRPRHIKIRWKMLKAARPRAPATQPTEKTAIEAAAKQFVRAALDQDIKAMRALMVEAPPEWTKDKAPEFSSELRNQYAKVPETVKTISLRDGLAAVTIPGLRTPEPRDLVLIIFRRRDGWRVCFITHCDPKAPPALLKAAFQRIANALKTARGAPLLPATRPARPRVEPGGAKDAGSEAGRAALATASYNRFKGRLILLFEEGFQVQRTTLTAGAAEPRLLFRKELT